MKFLRSQNGVLKAQPETAPSNFISNPSPTKDTTGWAAYSDSASSAPTDGTGGSPTVTWTRTTSSPLSETASFLLTKSASNLQGNGVSYDFTVNSADKAKVHTINFDYEVASGTYADGDLTVWIYDVTNAVLIQPSASSILNGIGPQQKQTLSFQTNSNSTSYRLIIHCASTSAVAYTVKFDNFQVSRQSVSQGTVVTDWVSYTPTFGALGTGSVASVTGRWRRVGDSMEVQIEAAKDGSSGTGTAAVYASIPSGFSIDAAKIDYTTTGSSTCGSFLQASTAIVGVVQVRDSTTVAFYYSSGFFQGTNFSANVQISASFKVPILGWSSSQLLSSDADTRVVAAEYYGTGSTVTNAGDTVIIYSTKVIDSLGAYDTGTGRYNVNIPGQYRVSATYETAAITSGAVTSPYMINIKKNGTTEALQNWPALITSSVVRVATITSIINANAGDYIEIVGSQQLVAGAQSLSNSNRTRLSIERISGPSQIAASEEVNAKRYSSSTAAVYNSATTVAWTTSLYDTHGGFGTSSVYTVRTPGKYQVTARINLASVAASAVERAMYV